MDNILKQIDNFKKQNDCMESAFKNKNIQFTKLSIDSVDIKAETELQSTPCSTAQSVTWEPQNEDPTRAEASRQLLITYTWDSIYIYYIIYICSLHDQWSYW